MRHTKPNARRSNNRGGSSSSVRKPPEQMNCSKCGRCGLQGHRSDQCQCTRDKRCHKCNRVGHFEITCRSKQRKPQPHDRNSVHFLDNQDLSSDSFSDTEASVQVYALDSQSHITTITITNVPIQVTIDSGASCNVLNTADSEKLASCGLKLRQYNKTVSLQFSASQSYSLSGR